MSLDRLALALQFDEAIDVLERSLRCCPDELWEAPVWRVSRTDPWVWPQPGVEPMPARTEESIQAIAAFWAVAYHCLWFLDSYLELDMFKYESPDYVRGGPEEQFPAADGAAPIPGISFSRDALLRFLEHGRRKVHRVLPALSETQLESPLHAGHPHHGKTFEQLLGVNLAHVRDHGSDLIAFAERGVGRG